MNTRRVTVVLVGIGLVFGASVAGAVTTTTTTPITLCADAKRVVTIPATGGCTSKQTSVAVASASDVSSLAARMDAAEATNTAQATAISAVSTAGGSVSGSACSLPNGVVATVGMSVSVDGVITLTCGGADTDEDGWTIARGDCDDSSSGVNPGAVEIANGRDDNCEGTVDEPVWVAFGTDVGECSAGLKNLTTGETVGVVEPSAEITDGKDNDCDGVVDNVS